METETVDSKTFSRFPLWRAFSFYAFSLSFLCKRKVHPQRKVAVFGQKHFWVNVASVDESMVGFKGRLSWIQYMPKKPRKWGIKIWKIADGANGYVSNLKVYTGKLK